MNEYKKTEYPVWDNYVRPEPSAAEHMAAVTETEMEEKLRKAHSFLFRRCMIMAGMLLLGCLVVLFFLKFSIKVLSEEGKITLSVAGRNKLAGQPETVSAEGELSSYPVDRALQRAEDDGSRMFFAASAYNKHEESLRDIYAKVAPSVVCVQAIGKPGGEASGVIMSETGYIITNTHIINGASAITVLFNGEELEARLVGSDAVTDIAVLKIDREGCPYAEFADSEGAFVGDTVVAIGNPLGARLPGTMTDGIICAINKDVSLNGHSMTLIQTNAALYDGSSGGPLVNMSGQVIGINTIDSLNIGSGLDGLGFAIPSNFVKPIVEELIEKGYISGRPSLGFEVMDYNLPAQAVLFYGTPGGVLISSVFDGSDAAKKGLKAGDVVVTVDGTDVHSVSELTGVISNYKVADTVGIVIYRSGSYYQTVLTLADEADLRK